MSCHVSAFGNAQDKRSGRKRRAALAMFTLQAKPDKRSAGTRRVPVRLSCFYADHTWHCKNEAH